MTDLQARQALQRKVHNSAQAACKSAQTNARLNASSNVKYFRAGKLLLIKR